MKFINTLQSFFLSVWWKDACHVPGDSLNQFLIPKIRTQMIKCANQCSNAIQVNDLCNSKLWSHVDKKRDTHLNARTHSNHSLRMYIPSVRMIINRKLEQMATTATMCGCCRRKITSTVVVSCVTVIDGDLLLHIRFPEINAADAALLLFPSNATGSTDFDWFAHTDRLTYIHVHRMPMHTHRIHKHGGHEHRSSDAEI